MEALGVEALDVEALDVEALGFAVDRIRSFLFPEGPFVPMVPDAESDAYISLFAATFPAT